MARSFQGKKQQQQSDREYGALPGKQIYCHQRMCR
jgi:hypothetical protein